MKMEFYNYFRVFLLLTFILIKARESCIIKTGPYKDKCCEHFMLNTTTNECIPCPVGYTGHNCSSPCPSPSYGFQCEKICFCPAYLCHFITGCPVSNGNSL
ncbi:platelet endothelial aggregation receptor 1-like [Saccostrea cucullata]|uniref:platelet endothelial aggregation receptor 1-like n=1 Tax=Saccostrea cuccullata TaxID=36930 RepID=UPI002ED5735E